MGTRNSLESVPHFFPPALLPNVCYCPRQLVRYGSRSFFPLLIFVPHDAARAALPPGGKRSTTAPQTAQLLTTPRAAPPRPPSHNSRERNREHARRTRLRKKAQLQALQTRAQERQEAQVLDDALVKIQLAHILVDMSTPRVDGHDANAEAAAEQGDAVRERGRGRGRGTAGAAAAHGGGRERAPDHPFGGAGEGCDLQTPTKPGQLRINVPKDPPVMQLQHQTTVNWKEGYVVEPDGSKRQLSAEELENLRQERNACTPR